MEREFNLNYICEVFDNSLDNIYNELEDNIFTANDKDREYIQKTNMDIELRTINFYEYLKKNYDITDKNKQEILDKIQEFKNTIYNYIIYFVKKGFKIGFKNGINLAIKEFNDGNKN